MLDGGAAGRGELVEGEVLMSINCAMDTTTGDDIWYAKWQMYVHKQLCRGERPITLTEFKELKRDLYFDMREEEND